MQNECQAGFSLLETILSIVAIGSFLMLAIDPYLDLRTKQMKWEQETEQLEQMATDQVENRTASYVLKQGAWCNETMCLASGIRNDPSRTLIRPMAEPISSAGNFDIDPTRSSAGNQPNE
ncbi:hypothetical protein RSA42_07375 [Exiguobacterium indicum]|uniref:hypothetical protein n=1 Tax=Exiguobacterium indicum TaxID=296995 RepID=UPI0007379632|nr:hypothetical protein [Exiguobacterium indicum]KTR60741.1 hypothetical protein RSA42_07375 [Exiguobacterium indicum]